MTHSAYQSKRTRLREHLLTIFQSHGLKPGDKIPSVRSLASELDLSPATVLRMLKDMEESNCLVRTSNQGLYLPHRPVIGYLGYLPGPEQHVDLLINEATQALFEHMHAMNYNPVLLNFQRFHSGSPIAELTDLDGLLINSAHWDSCVAKALSQFNGKVMILNQCNAVDTIPSSQTMTDFRPAVREFIRKCDWSAYHRIVMVRANHSLAIQADSVFASNLELLTGRTIDETIVLDYDNDCNSPDMRAFSYFSERLQENWARTLVVSASGYFSQGLYMAFSRQQRPMPGILSFDNLEARIPFAHLDAPFFTAIERRMPQVYTLGFDELLRSLEEPRHASVSVICIPADLIIRRSVSMIDS